MYGCVETTGAAIVHREGASIPTGKSLICTLQNNSSKMPNQKNGIGVKELPRFDDIVTLSLLLQIPLPCGPPSLLCPFSLIPW